MKNIGFVLGWLFLAPCLAVSFPVFAMPDGIIAANNQVSLDYVSTRVHYAETGDGIYGTNTGTLDTETGSLRGVSLSAAFMDKNGMGYLRVEARRVAGSTAYVGSLMGGTFGSVSTTSGAVMTDLSAALGIWSYVRESFMLTPYAEYGNHKWNRIINDGEVYSHYYFAAGLLAQYALSGSMVLAASGMYGRTAGASIDVAGSNGMSGFSGRLGDSPIWRVGASADYALGHGWRCNAAVDYTRFRYGMSGTYPVGGSFVAWEPGSMSSYVTIKAGFGMMF